MVIFVQDFRYSFFGRAGFFVKIPCSTKFRLFRFLEFIDAEIEMVELQLVPQANCCVDKASRLPISYYY